MNLNVQKCRVETNHESFVGFLEANEASTDWVRDGRLPLDQLVALRISDSIGVVAYIWGYWTAPATMAFAYCVARERRGVGCVERETITKLLDFAYVLGADRVALPLPRSSEGEAVAVHLQQIGLRHERAEDELIVVAAELPLGSPMAVAPPSELDQVSVGS